jgi:hypothetical protein
VRVQIKAIVEGAFPCHRPDPKGRFISGRKKPVFEAACPVKSLQIEMFLDKRIYQPCVERLPSSPSLEWTPFGNFAESGHVVSFVPVPGVTAAAVARPNEASFEEFDLFRKEIRQSCLRIFVIAYYNTCGLHDV